MTKMKATKTLILIYLLVFCFIISNPIETLSTMRKVTDKSEIPKLILTLKSKDSEKRMDAAYKLSRLKKEECATEVKKALIDLLSDHDPDVKIEAIGALGGLKIKESIPSLTDILDEPDNNIVEFAVQSIGLIGTDSKKTIQKLLYLLKHNCRSIRISSAKALARIGEGAQYAVPVMISDMNREHLRDQLHCIKVIELFGPQANSAVKPLKELLKNTKLKVRQAACRALIAIGSKQALKALENHNEDCDIRWMQLR